MKKKRDKNGFVGHNVLGCRWKLYKITYTHNQSVIRAGVSETVSSSVL